MIPPGARVWIAMGHTDMRKGMQGLALLVQQHLRRDPHGGDLFVFRGRAGSLVKIIWHMPRRYPKSIQAFLSTHSNMILASAPGYIGNRRSGSA